MHHRQLSGTEESKVHRRLGCGPAVCGRKRASEKLGVVRSHRKPHVYLLPSPLVTVRRKHPFPLSTALSLSNKRISLMSWLNSVAVCLSPMFLLNSQPLLQLGLECPPKARVLKTWSSDWSFGEMTHIFTKGPGVSLATLRETLKPFLFHSPSLLGCYEMGVSFHRGLLLWHYSFLQSKSTKAHHGTVDDTSEHVSNINLFSLQVDSSQAFDTVR